MKPIISAFILINLVSRLYSQEDSSAMPNSESQFKYRYSFSVNCKNQKCKSDLTGVGDTVNKTGCYEINCALMTDPEAGYCDCTKSSKRSVNGKSYTLLNPCEIILLYKHETRASKWPQYEYYFSKDIESPLVKLTKQNLKNVYTDNTAFQEKLEMVFRNDNELTRYDELYKMYVVNWLYNWVAQ